MIQFVVFSVEIVFYHPREKRIDFVPEKIILSTSLMEKWPTHTEI